jgi:hypothetical protein
LQDMSITAFHRKNRERTTALDRKSISVKEIAPLSCPAAKPRRDSSCQG